MAHGLDNVHHLHEMCSQEMQLLQNNLNQFQDSSSKWLGVFDEHWDEVINGRAVALVAYDNFLTNLSNMLDLSRKFNLHLQLNSMQGALFEALQVNDMQGKIAPKICNSTENTAATKCISTISIKSVEDASKETDLPHSTPEEELISMQAMDYSERSIPPAEEENSDSSGWLDIEDSKFDYQKKILSVYKVGSLLNACVTYVQDPEKLLVYVCDASSEDTVNVLLSHHDMLNYRQYAGLPPENEVFGLVLDNMVLRAVRRNPLEFKPAINWSKLTHNALLLDFGEVVQLSPTEIMYHLPKELREKPAQAMLCQLQNINISNGVKQKTLAQNLQDLLYKKCTFRVVSVEANLLRLQLQKEEVKETTPKVSVQKTNQTKPNPFTKNLNYNTNPFIGDLNLSDALEEAVPLAALPREPLYRGDNKNLPNGFTVEDMEMLYEEPLCTSNAMKAVIGYNPKDDLRICRFFDPKTGSCFKGANCRQEHTLLQPEGWTKDVLPAATIIYSRTPTIRYPRGTILSITPTHVGQLERFYAHINDPKVATAPLIFNPEDVPNSKRLQNVPLVFEMVLARYEDGLWYRAKVLETDEHNKMVKVFYVDYGNQQTIHIRELARCDYGIAKLPFQAVLCRLAGVRDTTATPEQRKLGINMLCRVLLNQDLNVRVIGNHDDLLVFFLEERFAQLPKTLIKMGCMQPFKTITVA